MSACTRTAVVLATGLGLWLTAAARDAADPSAPRGGEARAQHLVAEDDGVRIDELRVRGQTQRIVVQSKFAGARAYEIVPANQGRDLSQDKRTVGQRVWSVLSF